MVMDHGTILFMETIPVSQFKARCLAILQRVRQTRQPVRVTRFGVPVAEIMPPTPDGQRAHWIGSMRGTLSIKGDIVAPAADPEEWDAERGILAGKSSTSGRSSTSKPRK